MDTNFQKGSILLIDDDTEARQSLTNGLRKKFPFSRVESARSAQEAIRKFNKAPFDIVIFDMFLGDDKMNGLDLFELLRKGGARFYSIVITGFSDSFGYESGRLGMDAFFRKPVNPDELYSLISAHLPQQETEKIETKTDGVKIHTRLLPISLFLLGIIIAIISNVASSMLPSVLAPFLWLSWPLLLVLIVVSIVLMFKE